MPWQLNTDGGSRGNPGVAGCGFSLAHDGREVLAGGWFLSHATNNHAEYCALIWGLANALERGVAELHVCADSELMVKQMNGLYKVKNADLRLLHERARRLAGAFAHVTFSHVYRENNARADAWANKAMDERGPVGSYLVAFSETLGREGDGPARASGDVAADDAARDEDGTVDDPTGMSRAEAPDVASREKERGACPAALEQPAVAPHRPGAAPGSKTVLLGVTGGIAAYKACELVRCLQRADGDLSVKVVMTEHATQFVGPATLRALSGHEVAVGLFDEPGAPIHHVSLAKEADVLCIAPATANVIAKLANGVADDLLTTTALASRAPVVLAPAMNEAMWADASTQANIARCCELGMRIVGPAAGYQACGDEGRGRMSEPAEIADEVMDVLASAHALAGVNVLVTAGPTHEPLDPVRYLGNRSSGLQGYAIAEQAAARGAHVTLVSGPVALEAPAGVEVLRVQTAREMLSACREPFAACDAAFFVAAVCDYRPGSVSDGKLKRDGGTHVVELVENPDIAATLSAGKGSRFVACFAAETHDVLEHARVKLTRKNADLIVANDVSQPGLGFGSEQNHVWFVSETGTRELPTCSKRHIARCLLDALAVRLA